MEHIVEPKWRHYEHTASDTVIRVVEKGPPELVRVCVVADNCTDGTATVARAAGAECIERNDPAKHGKGYYVYTGLAFFRQLPAGVPGAYRLFANLLSLGK